MVIVPAVLILVLSRIAPVDEGGVHVPVPVRFSTVVPVMIAVDPPCVREPAALIAEPLSVVVDVPLPNVSSPLTVQLSAIVYVTAPVSVSAFGHVLPLLVSVAAAIANSAPLPLIVIAATSVIEPLTVICCDIVIVFA